MISICTLYESQSIITFPKVEWPDTKARLSNNEIVTTTRNS